MIKTYFSSLFLMVLLISSISCSQKEQEVERPNIIIILTDDQGFGDLSLTGNPDISTPNIDGLASEGMFFDRFYVSAVCSPTRAELLTGRYAVRSGVYSTSEGGERIDLDEETIADVFLKNGYRTGAFGKWHSGMQPPYHPNARGFEEFYGFCSGHWGNYFDPIIEHNGELVKAKGFLTDDLIDKSVEFIRDKSEDPFFVYLPLNTPHSPMQVPDKFWDAQAQKSLTTTHLKKDQEDTTHTKAALAMVENIDWNVGRLMDSLDNYGLKENTIVIYFSDNGPNGNRWNDGMRGTKGTVDEGGVRSPFIISWPNKIPKNSKVESISSAMDLLPTLVDLAGLDHQPKNPLDGQSLAQLALGQSNDSNEDRYIVNHWRDRTSVRTQKWRLDYEDRLYDMIEDPNQTTDVATAYQDEYEKLMALKNRFTKNVLTELPENDDRPMPVGHADFGFTQLPARDAEANGSIIRSNRWPNCSYYTNWVSEQDSIFWNVDVLTPGKYKATVHYTLPNTSVGCELSLAAGSTIISKTISEAHDPVAYGMENDRLIRIESYVKDFKPLELGIIGLEEGQTKLALIAQPVENGIGPEIRLLMINRVE